MKYYTKKGKKYCSRKCFSTTLPKCALCGKPFTNGTIFNNDPNKVYCSKCSSAPKCFSCMLPGNCATLKDGRKICQHCSESAVYEQDEAEKLMNEIRLKMERELDLTTNSGIKLKLTDSKTLGERSPDYSTGHELGLYLYEFTLRTSIKTKTNIWGKELSRKSRTYKDNISYSIYILYGTPRGKMIEVLAHELGHDWMQKHYPGIKDLKIKEGWAEYVASQVNVLYGQAEMNKRMANNRDKIYGEGYRMIAAIGKKSGLAGLKAYFRRNSY